MHLIAAHPAGVDHAVPEVDEGHSQEVAEKVGGPEAGESGL